MNSGGSSSRPYRKLEPAPAQPVNHTRAEAQRSELRAVQFDHREEIKDYTPIEACRPAKGRARSARSAAAAAATTTTTIPVVPLPQEPEEKKKRERGLREVVLESPGAVHVAVTATHRTHAGQNRAAAAARAAVSSHIQTRPETGTSIGN
ncbi:hypothetical protein CONLIGDRAFT_687630 [Coniochaeta ligniaria NRRL 30616]|uniref:Uncharacterized protein n=1 Tax=Coniochaeta ligniaria NRRL 30616 TaxID=1408157 RepID=A0A1J7IXQ1_9PEZI|nr:hypothetical protein CONLIGDRAFT_687630 [Coniochaeta ligniaria NRRL 30616]